VFIYIIVGSSPERSSHISTARD